jgi:endoglucanase
VRRFLVGLALFAAVAFGIRALAQMIAGASPSLFRRDAAAEFFRRYVDADGRVVRHDQGSDTVSEGQAYAMLLAVAMDDSRRFATVWGWTKRTMQRSDGLLSWHFADGRIVDTEPASDADADAAHALLLAADRFGVPSYFREARRIAGAILADETVTFGDGRVLVAGTWARKQRIVNPSYLDPRVFRAFADAFDDEHWANLSRTGIEIVRRLTSDGAAMPPDWAQVGRGATVHAIDAPDGMSAPGSNGLDAARTVVRFAASCDEHARSLASRMTAAAGGASGQHPLEIVAQASASDARGDDKARDELLLRAEHVARMSPTYYGWAWVALGPAMLDGRALGSC